MRQIMQIILQNDEEDWSDAASESFEENTDDS